jgi:hypothetical protein
MLRRVRVTSTRSASPLRHSASPGPTYSSGGSRLSARWPDGVVARKRDRQGHKLTSDVLTRCLTRQIRPPASPALAAANSEEFAITAHPRSIERALGRQENAAESANGARTLRAARADLAYEPEEVAGSSSGAWHGPLSWPGNGGMDAGMPVAPLPRQLAPVSNR